MVDISVDKKNTKDVNENSNMVQSVFPKWTPESLENQDDKITSTLKGHFKWHYLQIFFHNSTVYAM